MSEPIAVVTGGAGFIGSHLCAALVRMGYKVISLDNYFTGSPDLQVAGVEYRHGHTKEIEQLIPEIPAVVYHLGEYARVEVSFNEPDLVWDLNMVGTAAVLEFCRKRNSKIVYAGSSTKFGDGGLGRTGSPYAWSKAVNTELVKNYGDWYNLPFAIAYFYNVYGPGERSGRYGTLVQIFADKIKKGEPLTVHAPGTQKRNFTHVHDIVRGLVMLGEQGQGDNFGIGHEKAYTVLEVAEMFGGEIVMLPEPQGNRKDSTIDTSKLQALGWQTKHRLEDYIAQLRNPVT